AGAELDVGDVAADDVRADVVAEAAGREDVLAADIAVERLGAAERRRITVEHGVGAAGTGEEAAADVGLEVDARGRAGGVDGDHGNGLLPSLPMAPVQGPAAANWRKPAPPGDV